MNLVISPNVRRAVFAAFVIWYGFAVALAFVVPTARHDVSPATALESAPLVAKYKHEAEHLDRLTGASDPNISQLMQKQAIRQHGVEVRRTLSAMLNVGKAGGLRSCRVDEDSTLYSLYYISCRGNPVVSNAAKTVVILLIFIGTVLILVAGSYYSVYRSSLPVYTAHFWFTPRLLGFVALCATPPFVFTRLYFAQADEDGFPHAQLQGFFSGLQLTLTICSFVVAALIADVKTNLADRSYVRASLAISGPVLTITLFLLLLHQVSVPNGWPPYVLVYAEAAVVLLVLLVFFKLFKGGLEWLGLKIFLVRLMQLCPLVAVSFVVYCLGVFKVPSVLGVDWLQVFLGVIAANVIVSRYLEVRIGKIV